VLSMLGVKEKNTKTNKIIIVKNRKLATQNVLFNMHINYPFDNIKKAFPFMENMLKYDFMKYRHRLLYYRVAPIYIRYILYTTNV
jgi:hypothetical protein